MGKNKKESLIFVLMIAATMVFIMSCYNILIMDGPSWGVLTHAVMGFIPAYLFALIGDLFIVGKIVKKIIPNFVKPTDSMKKRGLFMCFFTGTGMVIWMSFFGAVVNVGFGPDLLLAYGMGILKNYIFAIPLNLLIVSPLIRMLFFKMFPPVHTTEEKNTTIITTEESFQM